MLYVGFVRLLNKYIVTFLFQVVSVMMDGASSNQSMVKVMYGSPKGVTNSLPSQFNTPEVFILRPLWNIIAID